MSVQTATKPKTVKSGQSLENARRMADKLIIQFGPFCTRIEIAGSIRRKKPVVGDIELVAIPRVETRQVAGQYALFNPGLPSREVSLLDEWLEHMATMTPPRIEKKPPPGVETLTAWGERYKKFWVYLSDKLGFIQVDLFLTTAETWGSIFTIRTGPAGYSHELVKYIKYKTPYEQRDGALWDMRTGERVHTPSEMCYFETIGVPWWPPEYRTEERLREWADKPKQAAPKPKPKAAVKVERRYVDAVMLPGVHSRAVWWRGFRYN